MTICRERKRLLPPSDKMGLLSAGIRSENRSDPLWTEYTRRGMLVKSFSRILLQQRCYKWLTR